MTKFLGKLLSSYIIWMIILIIPFMWNPNDGLTFDKVYFQWAFWCMLIDTIISTLWKIGVSVNKQTSHYDYFK